MKVQSGSSVSFVWALMVMVSALSMSHGAMAQSAAAPPAQAVDAAAAPAVSADERAELPQSQLGLTKSVEGLSEAQMAPEVRILRNVEKEIKKSKERDIYERSSVPSLVFTPSQYALLREARIGFNTRTPTSQELRMGDPNDPNYRPPVALRDVRLGGIAFESPDDWTVWLNGKRVTPDAMPSEAVDLRVYRDFIELRWYDSRTNQVFPIRLRPSQRFNLDTRVFLPG